MTRGAASKLLIWEWLLGLATILGIMLVQTLLGKYGKNSRDIWTLLALVLITPLSMLVTSVISQTSREWQIAPASALRFWLAFLVGGTFILCVLLVVLIEPMSTGYFHLFASTGMVLVLWQVLIVAAIGAVVFEGR
ncbi:MAG TPA: hypothetical protein VMF67_12635 [Rhizomicrobium sp.]|nr:hypothetical protein [Rhizomicrobium sp.]